MSDSGKQPYEIRDHTADIQLRVYGKDLRELFLNATAGLYAVLGTIKTNIQEDDIPFTLNADSPTELLHDWLAEALFYAETRHVFLQNIHFIELTDTSLRAVTIAATIDMDQTVFDREIKAVTYHDLNVTATDDGYRADVILDI